MPVHGSAPDIALSLRKTGTALRFQYTGGTAYGSSGFDRLDSLDGCQNGYSTAMDRLQLLQ